MLGVCWWHALPNTNKKSNATGVRTGLQRFRDCLLIREEFIGVRLGKVDLRRPHIFQRRGECVSNRFRPLNGHSIIGGIRSHGIHQGLTICRVIFRAIEWNTKKHQCGSIRRPHANPGPPAPASSAAAIVRDGSHRFRPTEPRRSKPPYRQTRR
jgi:hypothetical protein